MKLFFRAMIFSLVFFSADSVHAILWDRGGGLIYDDVLDVTWLQDADYADTTGDRSRLMNWERSLEWAANLEYYDSVRGVVWDDWRLPSISPVNGISFDERLTGEPSVYDGSADEAHNVSAPGSTYPGSTASELAYMFYNNLGCLAKYDLSGHTNDDFGVIDPTFESGGPGGMLVSFINLERAGYWTESNEGISTTLGVWRFDFQSGMQGVLGEGFGQRAWAVRDGDVAAIDNSPSFSNASLPASVTHPDRVYFSGSANDDNGLAQITMTVSGPAGTHTAFTEAISGTSHALDGYYFDSANTTYANIAGNYTVTLRIVDGATQSRSKIFNTTVNFPVVDNAPYFSNASLPSTVTHPNKIYFSGTANDDNGLAQITMTVSGPAGTHTVFTEAISGTSHALDGYYFDSANTTYANLAGNYTVTLRIVDSADQAYSLNFNTSVNVPAVDNTPFFSSALLPTSVTHPDRIYFSGTANDDNGLTRITMTVSGPAGTHTAFTETISGTSHALDGYFFDSANTTYANLAGNYTTTLRIVDSANQAYSLNFNTSVNIPAVDNAPYFSNASLPTSVTHPDRVYFSGTANDDNGLALISMTISGPTGTHTAFTEAISGTSHALDTYFFDCANTTYANLAGNYAITLRIVDSADQAHSLNFNTSVNIPAVDNAPYFSNASLPTSVIHPDRVYFSGTANDDNGLAQITMTVSGPAGTHIAFTEGISGPFHALDGYYFDSANTTYANLTGNYTITLRIVDSATQALSLNFNTTVNIPAIDNAPYFSNASLPTSVTHPGRVYFSGTANDDNGLAQITMTVSGPAGTHTAFTEAISGTSHALDGYYFDSTNSTYSNFPGVYTIALIIIDSTDQMTDSTFSVEINERLYPQISISPNNVDFGEYFQGAQTLPIEIIVTNNGNDNLTITDIYLTDYEYFNILKLDGNNCESESVLEPNNNCIVAVNFTPSNSAIYEFRTVLTVLSDDRNSSEIEIPINGRADDFGGACISSRSIGVGDSMDGELGHVGDNDFFFITVPADGTLVIYTSGGTDTYGKLYNEDCVLISEDDDNDSGHDAIHEFPNFRIHKDLEPGEYYISVSNINQNIELSQYTINTEFESRRLISTSWGQVNPYTIYFDEMEDDVFSPNIEKDSGKQYLVGCTAVAVGQLINYYITERNYQDGWIDALLQDREIFPRFVTEQGQDYQPCQDPNNRNYPGINTIGIKTENSYLPSIPSNYSMSNNSPPEGGHIRLFLWAVAIGLDSRFLQITDQIGITDGGGIYDHEYYNWVNDYPTKIETLLRDRFRFNPNLLGRYSRIDIINEEEDYIKDSISRGDPVLVGMFGSSLSDGEGAGHATLIDGYRINSDGSFHVYINWGWGNGSAENDNPCPTNESIHAGGYSWNRYYIFKDTVPHSEGTNTTDDDDRSGDESIDGSSGGGGGGCFIGSLSYRN